MPVRIVALYRFTPLEDCAAIRARLAAACCARGVKGTLLLAAEGINGTIAGADDAVDHVLTEIRALPGCANIETKESRAPDTPFHRMKVRIKREIVTMGQPHIDPLGARGHYVAPQDWNMLLDQPDTILIDTRNEYEVAVGTVAGAIDPRTKAFSDFPTWFAAHREELLGRERPPRIAMFCTGGIRCEKATAFLRAEGLEDVHHLKGGILAYLETVAPEQSRWQGECFVFDERVAVGQGLEPGSHILCRACRMPVSAEQQRSALFVEGISCPACHADRTDRQREGYAERHRQTMLAEARGVVHVGAPPRGGDRP